MPSKRKSSHGEGHKHKRHETKKQRKKAHTDLFEKNKLTKKHHVEEEKTFKLGQLNSTIITTKRLTVGVKGIFGNAKSSSSVYRDLLDRIENKKYSKAVASEIELSLSRIVPSRNPGKYTDKSLSNSCPRTFRTPGDTSTPLCRDLIANKSNSDGSFVPRSVSISSSSMTSSSKTPVPLKTQYVKIAESIRTSIPCLKIFKGSDYLKDVKNELKKMHQKKCSLTVIPKFRREEFSQPTPPSEKKKKIPENQSFTEPSEKLMGLQPSCSKKPFLTKDPSCSVIDATSSRDIPCDEKPCDKNRSKFNVPMDEKPSTLSFNPPATNSTANNIEQNLFPIFSDLVSESYRKTGHEDTTMGIHRTNVSGEFGFDDQQLSVRNHLFNNSLPNIQNILSKPINTLRCCRKRSNRPLECRNKETSKSADFLDYIDSIPIRALENELLGGGSSDTSTMVSQTSNSMSFELVKPTMKSPSPPQLYRMNMY